MAAITFPPTPDHNDTYTANGRTWVYDNTVPAWRPQADPAIPPALGDTFVAHQVAQDLGEDARWRAQKNIGVSRNNLVGTATPDEANDTTEGYSVLSIWADVTNDKAYICLDSTADAAVWKPLALTPAEVAALVDVSAEFDAITTVGETAGHVVRIKSGGGLEAISVDSLGGSSTLTRSALSGTPNGPTASLTGAPGAGSIVVVGSGDIAVDGLWLIWDTFNARPEYRRYNAVDGAVYTDSDSPDVATDYPRIYWAGGVWYIAKDGVGGIYYQSAGNEATPDLAAAWVVGSAGTAPAPSVDAYVLGEDFVIAGASVADGIGQFCRVGDATPFDWYQWNGSSWVFVRRDGSTSLPLIVKDYGIPYHTVGAIRFGLAGYTVVTSITVGTREFFKAGDLGSPASNEALVDASVNFINVVDPDNFDAYAVKIDANSFGLVAKAAGHAGYTIALSVDGTDPIGPSYQAIAMALDESEVGSLGQEARSGLAAPYDWYRHNGDAWVFVRTDGADAVDAVLTVAQTLNDTQASQVHTNIKTWQSTVSANPNTAFPTPLIGHFPGQWCMANGEAPHSWWVWTGVEWICDRVDGSADPGPVTVGPLTGTVTLDIANGRVQKADVTGTVTIGIETVGVADGGTLSLRLTPTGANRNLYLTSILLPSDSGLSISPKNMTVNKLYVLKFMFNGVDWMLISLVGGY